MGIYEAMEQYEKCIALNCAKLLNPSEKGKVETKR
jgi:hypothetical protein